MDQVIPVDVGVEASASVSVLLIEFGQWLDRQRGLSPVTVHNYCWHVEQFLGSLPGTGQEAVSVLDAGAVTAFMVEFCRDRNTNSAKSMARSVRSFLRFAHATGRTPVELWGAVPASAGWHLASLPKAVPAADVDRLVEVAAIRARLSATGRRDYAVVLLLARTGPAPRRGRSPRSGRHRLAGRRARCGRQGRAGRAVAVTGSARRGDRGVADRRTTPRVRHGRCSPRSGRPVGHCRLGRSVTSWAACAARQASTGSAPTGCGTRWPATCCAVGRR